MVGPLAGIRKRWDTHQTSQRPATRNLLIVG
jgi:hypothetical protein